MTGGQQLAGLMCLIGAGLMAWFMYLYMVYDHDKKEKS